MAANNGTLKILHNGSKGQQKSIYWSETEFNLKQRMAPTLTVKSLKYSTVLTWT